MHHTPTEPYWTPELTYLHEQLDALNEPVNALELAAEFLQGAAEGETYPPELTATIAEAEDLANRIVDVVRALKLTARRKK